MKNDDFSDLPRYVQDYTEEQKERCIEWLKSQTLKKLRRFQGINKSQIQSYFSQRHQSNYDPKIMISLQAMGDIYAAAVGRKCF